MGQVVRRKKFGFAVQREKLRYNRGFVNAVNVPIHRLHFLPGT